MTDTERLNEIILDLIVPNSARDLGAISAGLSASDWDYILVRGQEHRFLPLFYWTLDQSSALGHVPDHALRALKDALQKHTFRTLTTQREMLLLHRILTEHCIEHVFLKGAFLAHFIYPHPALRPLRDLDVVVRPEDAERAQEALIAAGYTPRRAAPGMIAAHVKQEKHLPGLVSPGRGIAVELHVRVGQANGILAGLDAFRNIARHKLGEEMLPFMDPTDLLIHLCVHAANFHTFNNGPLVIADLGFLLRNAALDAQYIMMRATELGVTKPVSLTLAMTQSCWGDQEDNMPSLGNTVPAEVLTIARRLCLRSFDERSNVDFYVSISQPKGILEKAFLLGRKLFPDKKFLALEYGMPRSYFEQTWFYSKRLYRILFARIPELAKGYGRAVSSAETENAIALKAWMNG